jgi:CoA:oxalate CoA-transferase
MAQMYVWTAGVTKAEAYERGSRFRAPISPVNTMADLLASKHLAERASFRAVEHPIAGTMRYPGPPARMPATPPQVGAAPTLGEHNAGVLSEMLGLSARDLASLSASGVI